MFTIRNYVQVKDLDEALALRKKNKNNVVLGGNLWLKMGNRTIQNAIDLSGLGLEGIEETEDAFVIGCMTSLRDLEVHPGLHTCFQGAVEEALKHIVGVQFRNCATVGGSLFPRFGFSDVLSIMLALDAEVELHGRGTISIQEFARLSADQDILVRVRIKKDGRRVVYKSHRMTETDFPVLTCAVSCLDGKYSVVLGARPKQAFLVDQVELVHPADENEVQAFAEKVVSQVEFGSNMRGSKEYRTALAKVLIKRCVQELVAMQ